jgi:hypothetical protein
MLAQSIFAGSFWSRLQSLNDGWDNTGAQCEFDLNVNNKLLSEDVGEQGRC